jgi:hypothetical protein
MIRHQTRDNALMSSSSSTKSINPDGTEVPLWGQYPIVSRWPFKSDIAVFRVEIVVNTARSFLLVAHRQNMGLM